MIVSPDAVRNPMTLRNNPRIDNSSSLDRSALRSPILPSDTAIANYAGHDLQPNRGVPLNLDWVEAVRVNTSAVERRAQTIGTRRTVKKEWQAAWLLRAITCMDLTTLSGDDTDERVRRLCAKARQPIQQELVQKLGIETLNIKVAAVCIYHRFVETARRAIEGSGIHVAAVSTGFPAGLSPFDQGPRARVSAPGVHSGSDRGHGADLDLGLDDRTAGLPAAAWVVPAGAVDLGDRHVDFPVEFRAGFAGTAQQAGAADVQRDHSYRRGGT